jgi:hypothetical protein
MTYEEDSDPNVREICGQLYWAINVDIRSAGKYFGIREDAIIIDTAVAVLARHIDETILPSHERPLTPRPYASHLTPRTYSVPSNHPHGGHTPQELTAEIIHEVKRALIQEGFQLEKDKEKLLSDTTIGILARHVGIILEDDVELPCTPHPY